jgi:hypothetical protein
VTRIIQTNLLYMIEADFTSRPTIVVHGIIIYSCNSHKSLWISQTTQLMNTEILYVEDLRSPDFNGDRETMEYQGLNPDARGPFPPSVFGSGVKIIPT